MDSTLGVKDAPVKLIMNVDGRDWETVKRFLKWGNYGLSMQEKIRIGLVIEQLRTDARRMDNDKA